MNKNKIYIIAEIGLNHNGNLSLAKKMISAAKKSGADAVKFQSFRTEEFMSNKKIEYNYENKSKSINMFKMFKRLEFKDEWYKKINGYCKLKKIDFLTSVADKDSLKKYLLTKPKAIKIASEDIINMPLLKAISKTKKRVILSTGMADNKEISEALKNFKNKKNLYLLHCVSIYPTDKNLINLSRILSLRKKFNVEVGFSDHTLGIEASIFSIAFGAKIIEKHFTLSRKLKGPDQKISIEPQELKKMVSSIKSFKKMIGDGSILPKRKELNLRKKFRRSIVAVKKIKRGETIKKEMLSLKRPGTGLHPNYLPKLIGTKSKKNYKINQKISL